MASLCHFLSFSAFLAPWLPCVISCHFRPFFALWLACVISCQFPPFLAQMASRCHLLSFPTLLGSEASLCHFLSFSTLLGSAASLYHYLSFSTLLSAYSWPPRCFPVFQTDACIGKGKTPYKGKGTLNLHGGRHLKRKWYHKPSAGETPKKGKGKDFLQTKREP